MSTALLSLLALIAAIATSVIGRINLGVVALAMGGLLILVTGTGIADFMAGFPSGLFLTLAGVTFLFAMAEANDSLVLLANAAMRLAKGNAHILPFYFFLIACLISAVGPGTIVGVALVIPLAMPIGRKLGLSPLLISLMVAAGANAGNYSPVSAVGIIANEKLGEIGLGGHSMLLFAAGFLSHLLIALIAYGLYQKAGRRSTTPPPPAPPSIRTTRPQKLTIAILMLWIALVILTDAPIGLSAFAAGALLVMLRAAPEAQALRQMPWGIILMVCGVSTLVTLAEQAGGIDLLSELIAKLATPATINGVIAGLSGIISIYSSTSGVVLPMLIPTIPDMIGHLGGGDRLQMALSVCIGAAVVDISPLSTLGALCVGTMGDEDEARSLFHKLLLFGFAMTLIGAAIGQFIVPWLVQLA